MERPNIDILDGSPAQGKAIKFRCPPSFHPRAKSKQSLLNLAFTVSINVEMLFLNEGNKDERLDFLGLLTLPSFLLSAQRAHFMGPA